MADARPEIEPYYWDIKNLKWPVNGKTRQDITIREINANLHNRISFW